MIALRTNNSEFTFINGGSEQEEKAKTNEGERKNPLRCDCIGFTGYPKQSERLTDHVEFVKNHLLSSPFAPFLKHPKMFL